ncbi:MAG: hypothetical protein MN733_04985, partial [Nitrososphaera sp.]|nr:hypothetical protein [Nitrososphaera sp.]
MLGVATVGNATLIAMDGKPVLATDPWFGDEDEAYFGSWTLSYQIPSKHKQLIENAEYHWYSHGHPDHLNPHSIKRFTKNRVLLPDHVGGRIKTGLEARGLQVSILPERKWCTLSTNIRVMSISDYVQDAILLVEVNGRLFININDAGIRACRNFLRNLVAQYKESYALKLCGYGDADMINIFDEEGHRIEPRAAKKASVGLQLTALAKELGATHVIPFSSFHRYQREDSIWAEQYTTPISAYSEGFNHRKAQYVPPFVFVDCGSGEIIELNPPECPKS